MESFKQFFNIKNNGYHQLHKLVEYDIQTLISLLDLLDIP